MTLNDSSSFIRIDDTESLASSSKMEADRAGTISKKSKMDEERPRTYQEIENLSFKMFIVSALIGLLAGMVSYGLVHLDHQSRFNDVKVKEKLQSAMANATCYSVHHLDHLIGNSGALKNEDIKQAGREPQSHSTPASIIQSLQEVKDSVTLAKEDIIRSVQEVTCDKATSNDKLAQNLEQGWRKIAIVTFMKSDPSNLEVQQFASKLLWEKTRSEAAANLLVDAGAAGAMFDAMKFHLGARTVQAIGIAFIGRSSYYSKYASEQLVALGAVGLTVRAMELFPGDKFIQLEGCRTIGNLAYYSDDTVPALLSTAGIPILVEAMTNFEKSPDIQEQCSEAFSNVAKTDSGTIQTLVKTGAVEAVEASALKYENNTAVIESRDYLIKIRDAETS